MLRQDTLLVVILTLPQPPLPPSMTHVAHSHDLALLIALTSSGSHNPIIIKPFPKHLLCITKQVPRWCVAPEQLCERSWCPVNLKANKLGKGYFR